MVALVSGTLDRGFLGHPVHRTHDGCDLVFADAGELGDFSQRSMLGIELKDALTIDNTLRTAEAFTLTSCAIDSSLHALANKRSLQLCNCAENCEDHLSHRRRRIDRLTERNEVHTQRMKFLQGRNQMLDRKSVV